jgi:hypothetical protein
MTISPSSESGCALARLPRASLYVVRWHACAPPTVRAHGACDSLLCAGGALQLGHATHHARPDRTAQPSQIGGTGWSRQALWVVQTHTGPATGLQIREWEPKEVWISEERLGVQLVNMADNKTLVRRRIQSRQSPVANHPSPAPVPLQAAGAVMPACVVQLRISVFCSLSCLARFGLQLVYRSSNPQISRGDLLLKVNDEPIQGAQQCPPATYLQPGTRPIHTPSPSTRCIRAHPAACERSVVRVWSRLGPSCLARLSEPARLGRTSQCVRNQGLKPARGYLLAQPQHCARACVFACLRAFVCAA